MSVVIRDMQMPRNCKECELAYWDDYEGEDFCPFTDVICLSVGRQDRCPLVEVRERTEFKWQDPMSYTEKVWWEKA